MISHISINNFKSIKQLAFDCKKINVFIGDPNVGKSNLLEAISLLSGQPPKNLGIRFEVAAQLFYDNEISNPIQITATLTEEAKKLHSMDVDQVGLNYNYAKGMNSNQPLPQVRFYKHPTDQIDVPFGDYLLPPYGQNLFTLLQANPDFRHYASMLFHAKGGYRLSLRNGYQDIEMVKDVAGMLHPYPYRSFADTIKRDLFYTGILDTNQHHALLLEEPEANWYPSDFIHFAERIGYDETNQFFIVTHHDTFLSSMFTKSKPNQLAVFITYMDNYETKLYPLPETELSDLYEEDVIANWERYIEEL